MLIVALLSASLLTVQAWSPSPTGKTSIDTVLVANLDLFSTYVTALNAADLVGTLSGPGPFTVFAPSNSAFDALPTGTLTNLLKPENKKQLADLLTYHVAVGEARVKDLMDMKTITMEEGKSVEVRFADKDIFINSAKVTTADIDASNGVIHLIDAVLMPGSTPSPTNKIVDIAVATPDLSTLVTALKAADLVGTLSGTGTFTVFAPSNKAFAALPAGTLANLLKPSNKNQLIDLLTYHVVSGDIHTKDLMDMDKIKTVEGGDVTVRVSGGNTILINTAEVIVPDVGASNGVVHIIDAVLMPAGPAPAPVPSELPLCRNVLDGGDKGKGWQCRCDSEDTGLTLSNKGLQEFTKTTLVGCEFVTGTLYLSDNQITEITEGAFVGLKKLTGLWLDGNRIRQINEDAFVGLVDVTTLVLTKNSIATLPPNVFTNMGSLNFLYLGGNRIATLPKGVFTYGVGNIEILALDNNLITEILEGTFIGLGKLVRLDLCSNEITSFPVGALTGLNHKTDVTFSGPSCH